MIPSLGRRVAVVALLVLACAAGVMAAQEQAMELEKSHGGELVIA